MPVTILLTPDQSGLNQAVILAALSVFAVTLVSMQGVTVFNDAARTWTTSLPAGAAAQRMADRLVTAFALWPFWIMLLAVLIRHIMNLGDSAAGGAFGAILIATPLLWIGAALAAVARSHLGLILVVSGNLLLWGSLRWHQMLWYSCRPTMKF